MENNSQTHVGDCLAIARTMPSESIDLIYLDPPFFTQKTHIGATRAGNAKFSFADTWRNDDEYASFLQERLEALRPLLKSTGSVFVHCDKTASHIVRLLLDRVFGSDQFRSEIIWYFKRWSNSRKGLLPAHQNIYFYSKTDDYKFHTSYQEYSPATNIDQIMQKRVRDDRNKSVYARSDDGAVVGNGNKKGVPLSDVWEIPFLNPKAKERVGYPTQKPILLMRRIIELVTDEGDTVLDPFCGSGTTLVAAQVCNRRGIGIDISQAAIDLTLERLSNPTVTESKLLLQGRESYRQHSSEAENHLKSIAYTPVHRNKGIDALLRREVKGRPCFVRVQRANETVSQASSTLVKAAKNKGECSLMVIATEETLFDGDEAEWVDESAGVIVVPSTSLTIERAASNLEQSRLGIYRS